VQIAETVRAGRRATEPYQWRTSTTSGHFHHIDIDSIMLDPTCGSESAVRAAGITRGEATWYGGDRNGHVLIEWKIWMFDWENLAGLMRLARKLLFLAPGLQGFSRGTRMRSWVPILF
jgi:hypothetical protein